MQPHIGDYSQHVRHPRFGQAPRFTGLDPDPDTPGVHLHWNTRQYSSATRQYLKQRGIDPASPDDGSRMVPGTAIAADLSKQRPATVPVTHYYDIDKICRDCRLRFIFFAEEQKHWYEEIGFPLESDAVRCQVCRRRTQAISRIRKRYDELSQSVCRNTAEQLEMADCCLTLVNEGIFHYGQLEHVRALLNSLPEDSRSSTVFQKLHLRLRSATPRIR